MSASAASRTLRARLGSLLRSRRVRTAVVLVGAYQAYRAWRTHTTLHKPFSGARHRPGETVLDLDLDAVELVAREGLPGLSSAEEVRPARLVAALRGAGADPRVAALVVRGAGALRSLGLAELSELRAAVCAFTQAGKPAVLHVPEGLGGASNGTVPLYFSSAFDSVHIQPTSPVVVPGLSLATLFFRRMLDNVGVKAKKVARHEFKTAANSFTEDRFTDPHRESTEALLAAIMNGIVADIAEGRGISEADVRDAIDTAIMTPEEAARRGILDAPLYRDELPQAVRKHLEARAGARAAARVEAAAEWRAAMAALKDLWNAEGGAAEMWSDGDVLQNAAQFETALPVALSFGDQRSDISKRTTDAEVRAMKAHLAWLDTCPWEEVQGTADERHSVYQTDPNISAVVEIERRLCESAIRALEECPRLVEKYRQAADEDGDDSVLQLDQGNALSLIRWCRGMWRAKCMAARIVGTLMDSDDELKSFVNNDMDDKSKLELEIVASNPRLFLVGFTDDMRRAANSLTNGVEEGLVSKADGKDDKKSPEAVAKKRRSLRYVKFADYMETVNTEKRAVLDRSGASSLVKITSSDPFNKLPGTIDFQERNALLRLQLPGYHFAPWRMSVPKGDVVAVISIDGAISDERADITRSAIRRADKDPNIKAIVLRIDSPGGSATASDLISRAVEVAKKPVVASMSNVCASGGYFISAPCDKVFASNMTITGSIGVILSAFNTAGLFEKVGITADSCESGRFSKYFGAQGSITEWSDEFATRIDGMIDTMYADFVKVVAKGRNMQFEQAEKIARGRVWAGSDAHSLGLVDEIGGLQDAIEAAAELAYLAPDVPVRAIDYPTVAMQVQDAARKRGIIPSNLDEEGDEAVAQKRRGWSLGRRKKSPEGGDESETGKESQPAPIAVLSYLSSEYDNFQHLIADRIFSWLHGFLLSSSATSPASSFVEMVLGHVASALHRDEAASAIVQELERSRATAGRPAAIAPHFRVDK